MHIPGTPSSPNPPDELIRLADSVAHPSVTRVGLTTTEQGDWALMVRVPPGTSLPLQDLEAECHPFPVIYQHEPDEPPVARPAYPGRGE